MNMHSIITTCSSYLVRRFCSVKMGTLPENPIRYKVREKENIEKVLLDLLPLWILIALPFVYFGSCCFKYLWIKMWKKITQKCAKINCSTQMKCNDKSKECNICVGNCTCIHKVTEV